MCIRDSDQNGLGPGNDTIVIDPKIRIPVKILGGDGDDVIIGGSGPTILLGGPGNDLLEVSRNPFRPIRPCLLYTSDPSDQRSSDDLGGCRILN